MRSRPGTLTLMLTAWALGSLPVLLSAQTVPSPHPKPTTSGHRTTDHNHSPQHHLVEAKRVLDSLAATVKGDAGTPLADVRRHFDALERGWLAQQSVSPREATVPPGHATGHVTGTTGTAGTGEWMLHYSAIDRILDRVLAASTSSAGRASAGTTGRAGTAVTASADVKVDASTRTKLMEFRKHLNAFHAMAMTATPSRGAAALDVPGGPGAATTGERASPQVRGTTGIAAEPADSTRTAAAVDSAAIARLSSAIEEMLRADATPSANTVCVDRAKLEQLGRDLNALRGAR